MLAGAILVAASGGCRSTAEHQRVTASPATPPVEQAAYDETAADAVDTAIGTADPSGEGVAEAKPETPPVVDADQDAEKPERLPSPESSSEDAETIPAETVPAEPAAPTVEDVVRSVVEYFPLIQQAAAGRAIAYGEVLAASGAFDHKLDFSADSQPLDFYENHRSGIGLKRDTTWGGSTFAGYRVGRGVYEPWYLERETNKGGEFKAGFTAPLIRDRVIDANRSELWQAQVEQTRIEAEIDIQVIGSVRVGAVTYWEWVAAAERLRIAEAVLQLGVDRKVFLEKQIALGEKPRIDLVDNRRIIVSREAKVVDARRKLQQSAAKLSLFLRDRAGAPLVVSEALSTVKFGAVTPIDEASADQDIAYAVSNRPELRELSLQQRQLRIAISQASNETWPDVDAGLLVAQDVGEPTSSKRDKSEFELEASLTLSVPLERRKAFGKLRQLRGKVAQVRAKQRFTTDKIAIDVQTARAALLAAVQRVAQTAESLELAEQILQAEQQLYVEGQSTLFNLNIREQQNAEAAGELIDARRDYFIAEADFAAALGLAQPSLIEVTAR